jgi:uncharacterized protein (TIGR00255 family)
MSIKSMTGFARADGADEGAVWHWELRSVNGRGLDVRLRLPPGNEQLEPQVREVASRHLARGSVSITLVSERRQWGQQIRLNEQALAQVLEAAARVREVAGASPPSADGLISVKGVLEVVEHVEDADVTGARHAAMLASLDEALVSLVAARAGEGARLAAVLNAQIDEIEKLVDIVRRSPARTPVAIAERLRAQVARLTDGASALDPDRLHQEAVLLATRADVEEELQRLSAHISAARELLGENGAVGRKLDFLAQEFNREANTLCSKAGDVEISRAGLALKTVIDQLREQVQNIE